MENEYKIYVWEGDGVLTDYSNGLIVAVARTLEEALEAIKMKDDICLKYLPIDKYRTYPLNEPNAWLVWGGG